MDMKVYGAIIGRSRLRRGCIAAITVLALAVGLGSAGRAHANVGPSCFFLTNWGDDRFDEGVQIKDVGSHSFTVVVRWHKSLKCPAPGAIEILAFQRATLIGGLRSLTVYVNKKYDDWVQRFEHVNDRSGAGENTIVPNRPMVVWVFLRYFGTYKVERSFHTEKDPATDIGTQIIYRARDEIEVTANPLASRFGTTQVSFAIRDPKNPNSTFEQGLQSGWTCEPTPPRNEAFPERSQFAERSQRGCSNRRIVTLRGPGGAPLKPGTTYQIRMLIKNSFSGEQWGPIAEAHTQG